MEEMTEKKEESPKTNKRRRNTVENTTVENDSKEVELHETTESKEQEQFSSLDILWKNAFNELDQWAKHADFRDDMFLKEAMCFAESIKRNQENIKSVREQFNKEFANWELTAREEFLMSTTVLQHIFPKQSYEDINQQIDQIQKRTASVLSTPLQMVVNNQMMDQYFDMIERYIAARKKGRKQYVNTLKQAASLIYESQKGFVGLLTGQLKSFMFPLNKYLEKAEEVTKS
jgi:BMFP domain-containing protein YqiC